MSCVDFDSALVLFLGFVTTPYRNLGFLNEWHLCASAPTDVQALENIQRKATKPPPGVIRKTKKKTVKRKTPSKKRNGLEEPSSPSSSGEEKTAEHKAFVEIFGDRKHAGDQTLATKVLLEYCENFPEADEKSTKCRGKSGGRFAKRAKTATRKMDYEAFATAMEATAVVETQLLK